MAISHFPGDANWQILPQPLSLGEFLRQPMMRSGFFAHGLSLVTPNRSQTDTPGTAIVEVRNPQQQWLTASYAHKGASHSERCTNQATVGPEITCALPTSGTYEVRLFGGNDPFGSLDYLGQLEFNRR